MSRAMEDSAHPFKASVTSFRRTDTLTGEGVGVGDAIPVGVAAGVAVVVVLVVRPALELPDPLLSLLPNRSHAPSPTTASTSTVTAIVMGMTSALFFGLCAVAASYGPAAVGRGGCGVVAGERCGDASSVGITSWERISVGGGSVPPRPAEFISRVFS